VACESRCGVFAPALVGHRAFHKGYWAIDPVTLEIHEREGTPSLADLYTTRHSIRHVPDAPAKKPCGPREAVALGARRDDL
jgi:hypothetical protein